MSWQHRIISPPLISHLGDCLPGRAPGKQLKLFKYFINATWNRVPPRLFVLFLFWLNTIIISRILAFQVGELSLASPINTAKHLPTCKAPNFWPREVFVVTTTIFLKCKYGNYIGHQNKALDCKHSSSNSRSLKLFSAVIFGKKLQKFRHLDRNAARVNLHKTALSGCDQQLHFWLPTEIISDIDFNSHKKVLVETPATKATDCTFQKNTTWKGKRKELDFAETKVKSIMLLT